MIINLCFIALFLLLVGGSAFHGIVRNVGKARIRGIGMLVAAVSAVILTLTTKGFWISDELFDGVLSATGNQKLFGDLMETTPTLGTMLFECMSSLIAPLLCFVYFILMAFVMWIVYLILSMVLGERLRKHTEKCKYSRIRAGIWGGVWGLAAFVMLMLPIAGYMELATPVANSVLQADILSEDSEQTLREVMDDYVEPVDSGFVGVYRAVGGGLLVDCMTDFSLGDRDIDFSEELGSVSSLVCGVVQLADSEIKNYGQKEVAAMNAVADAFGESNLLTQIVGELVYSATDSWLNDRAFLNIDTPTAGSMAELFDPSIDRILEILRTDARDSRALQRDIRTVADLMNIFAEHHVFESLDDRDRLITALSENGVMRQVLETIAANSTMKSLLSEITNLGIRAIATTLDIPSDQTQVYGSLLDNIAKDVNYTKLLAEERRTSYLTERLKISFDEAGIAIEDEVLSCYSVSMIKDLVENEKPSITSRDVQAFFVLYAIKTDFEEPVAEQDESDTEVLSETVPAAKEDAFANTVYAGMTDEELETTGAAALANAYRYLMSLNFEDSNTDSENVSETVKQFYAELFEDGEEMPSALDALRFEKNLSETGYRASIGLKNSESLVTSRVVLLDLLIDTQMVTKMLEDEAVNVEITAITDIFTAAKDLYRQLTYGNNIGLEQMSNSIGKILDAFKSSIGYGEDRTADLFTAILQSKRVRDSAKLDVETATLMSEKATGGDETPNYTQMVTVVTQTLNVIGRYDDKDQEVSDSEIVTLIENINKQSAAMLEIYSTPERLESHNVSPQYSEVTAELLTNEFHFMAETEMSDEQYEQEAKALNSLLDVAFSAKENAGAKHLFAKDGEVSVFSGTADETVDLIMSSNAITHALKEALLEDGEIRDDRYDTYGLSAKLPAGSTDSAECLAAMERYYEQNQTEETKLSLYALSALLGITDQPFLG